MNILIWLRQQIRKSQVSYWKKRGYVLEDYSFDNFVPGTRVLDIGCGNGEQVIRLIEKGYHAVGIDLSWEAVKICKEKGLSPAQATAENLPFKHKTFDGIICKVTLPLTNEAIVIRNIGKVVRSGAKIELCCHGLGYYLYYLLFSLSLRTRIYAALTIINTWLYILTGKLWRDTLYQSKKRLLRYFHTSRLEVDKLTPSKSFLGMPVFIYYRLTKSDN